MSSSQSQVHCLTFALQSGDDTWYEVHKLVALELLSKLGKDENQQDGRFKFTPMQEVLELFLLLYVVVDNLLSKSHFVVERPLVSRPAIEK